MKKEMKLSVKYSELLKKLFALTDQLSQHEIHALISYLKTQLDDDEEETA